MLRTPMLIVALSLSTHPAMAADAATVPADLQDVLSQMEAAVLAADADAYLAHISPADPVFWQEQVNWAADLKLHQPVAFDLEVVEPAADDAEPEEGSAPAFVITDVRAEFDLRTTWTMGEGVDPDGPRQRTVTYPVVFEKVGTNGSARWLYLGENWVVTEEGNNRVMCFAGYEDLARQVIEDLPVVRTHVDAIFGRTIEGIQEVKVYPEMSHLQQSIYLSYVDSLGGWNEPGESIKILSSRRRSRDFKPLLGHEYGHVATFNLGPKANDIPWWILEGIAEYSGAEYASFNERSIRFVIEHSAAKKLAAWEDLADFRTINPELIGHVYRQGHHMVAFISERWGRTALINWLDAQADGASLDQACTDALGESFEAVDAAWRAEVERLRADDESKKEAENAPEGSTSDSKSP